MSGKYVASVSFGKDSLAMVLYILETGMPLDEVLFYDTGMEFDAIYNNRDRLKKILDRHGVKFTGLKPENPFLYDMLERPVTSKQKGFHLGYGWCGGTCRWGTTWKITALDKYAAGAVRHYVGIAADEPERVEKLEGPKTAPLADAGMVEADCLSFAARGAGTGWSFLRQRKADLWIYTTYSTGCPAGAAVIKTSKSFGIYITTSPNIGSAYSSFRIGWSAP